MSTAYCYPNLLVALGSGTAWGQVLGIIPASNVAGSGRGTITGGLLPWTTTGGSARVNLEIHFTVQDVSGFGGNAAEGPWMADGTALTKGDKHRD